MARVMKMCQRIPLALVSCSSRYSFTSYTNTTLADARETYLLFKPSARDTKPTEDRVGLNRNELISRMTIFALCLQPRPLAAIETDLNQGFCPRESITRAENPLKLLTSTSCAHTPLLRQSASEGTRLYA